MNILNDGIGDCEVFMYPEMVANENEKNAEGVKVEFWKRNEKVFSPEFRLYFTKKQATEFKKELTNFFKN